MSDATTTVTEAPTAPKAAKPKKPAAEKPAAKAAKKPAKAAPSKNGELSKSYLRVLGILAKAKGPLTRAKVVAKVEAAGISCYGGRISNESATYRDLIAAGLVREVSFDVDGKQETAYEATARGVKAAG